MPAKVGYLAIDTVDPNGLAPFWCGLLGVQVDTVIGDGDFLILTPTEAGLTVGFQRVPEMKNGKNRVHLDLVVNDLDAATAEVEELGVDGLNRATPVNLKVSCGAVWPTPKATSSTWMCLPPIRSRNTKARLLLNSRTPSWRTVHPRNMLEDAPIGDYELSTSSAISR